MANTPNQFPKNNIRPRGALLGSANLPADHITVKIIEADTKTRVERQPTKIWNRQLERSRVLQRQFVQPVTASSAHKSARKNIKLQYGLVALASLVLVVGLVVSFQTVHTNRAATSAVALLTSHVNRDLSASAGGSSNLPATTKPSNRAYDQYVVAGDLARYIKIPKIAVNARVMQVGVGNDGAISAPTNVYDTAWYNASSKPGQSGATLIDGHVASWNSPGIFHDLDKLVAGDAIQIVRGDGTVLNYKVVTSKTYPSDAVDMQSAVTPITAGKSGLNLITCTGSVKPGTSQYNQRLIIFAQLQ